MMNRFAVIRIRENHTKKELCIVVVFYLLLFQMPLSDIFPVFSYVDELFSLYGIAIIGCRMLSAGKIKMKRATTHTVILVLIYAGIGLLGNLLFQYQPIKYVLIDLLANLKFFLAIISGYVLFYGVDPEQNDLLLSHVKFSVICLGVMLILDQAFHVFPSPEMRYGFRVSQLIFGHATYLAGALAFLLSILLIYYKKDIYVHIFMCIIVLVFTWRGKAIAGAATYLILVYFLLIRRKRLRSWHVVIIGAASLWIGWDQWQYYYAELAGQSARSVLTQTSIEIMKDYFPIGTGFGTYASATAAEHYSPVYVKYGFLYVNELGGNSRGAGFFSDTFWPIIIGQTGAMGLILYVSSLLTVVQRILAVRKTDVCAYAAGIFIFAYLLISSTSEPAFNNSIAIPLAMLLGYIFALDEKKE